MRVQNNHPGARLVKLVFVRAVPVEQFKLKYSTFVSNGRERFAAIITLSGCKVISVSSSSVQNVFYLCMYYLSSSEGELC